jgi:uncharacterized protein
LALVLDTGVVLAAIEPRDDHHVVCSRLLENIREDRIVPAPTLVEIEYLLDRTPQVETFVRFLDDCRRGASESC